MVRPLESVMAFEEAIILQERTVKGWTYVLGFTKTEFVTFAIDSAGESFDWRHFASRRDAFKNYVNWGA